MLTTKVQFIGPVDAARRTDDAGLQTSASHTRGVYMRVGKSEPLQRRVNKDRTVQCVRLLSSTREGEKNRGREREALRNSNTSDRIAATIVGGPAEKTPRLCVVWPIKTHLKNLFLSLSLFSNLR